ncbi:helix-turn-helix domain-containing protein [Leptospira kirschneri]|uniref:helix-turn-helix domain-containing protein n=1 Tax=Leptospira kirschneri TaxID=29507 RepID=UPI0002BEA807|nr:helix-turn-helix transcriptional regulator [Leptospira kirschneri]EMO82480.1 Cro/C1-type HTH DNA-binding domain protein [Leptospira kirschneri str. 200801774]
MQKKTTFEREMRIPERRKNFDKKYNEFLLSEVIAQLMEMEKVSVRKLAKLTNLSPRVIHEIKTGKQENPTFQSLVKVMEALDAEIVFKKGRKKLAHVP